MANKTSVHLERSDRIGGLVLDSGVEGRPPTLDLGVLEQLREVARKAAADPESFRALVVRSTSAKYFAGGADLEALRGEDSRSIMDWVQRGNAVFAEIENLPMPVIARVDGYALGDGNVRTDREKQPRLAPDDQSGFRCSPFPSIGC
jgi:enoyl-CoA hydratase/carnithine racemase